MIYLVDLEYVETRYTAQWKTEFPQQIADQTSQDITVIEGPEEIAACTTPGAFLNFAGTNIYKAEQVKIIAEYFNNNQISSNNDFIKWKKKWNNSVRKNNSMKEARHLMKKYNPVFIARNHLVEEAIKKAVNGDMTFTNKLLETLSAPYQYQESLKGFMKQPSANFEECFQTYCGT